MAVLGVRQDMTFKILDQATLIDNTGKVLYNLPQQDMLAMRVVMRAAFAVANPASRMTAPSGGTRYPFAVLQDATP